MNIDRQGHAGWVHTRAFFKAIIDLFYGALVMQNYLLKTKRLGLRILEEPDIVFLEDLEKDPEVKKYFPDGVRDRYKTEIMIKKFITYYQQHGLPCFVIFNLETNEFIGRAGFGMTIRGEAEVGYVLHKKFWGQGFASEALSALLDYAKAHIKVPYIIAYADPNNIGSTRVMEKCGMEYYKMDQAKGIECKFYRIKNLA